MIVPRLYEDLCVLHQNTMPDRAYYVPSSTRGDRLAWHREGSDRLQMLSGCEWRFAWYPSIHDLQDPFYLPDYEPGKWWKKEMVPFCWQMRGYDSPQYTNIRYPFPFDPPYVPQDNPCGAYLHHFEWRRDPKAPCVFLNFEGVDSCFYVWLNGTYVGYSQISHHTSEFDVTELVREGDNLLAVLVLKWCDGSYLEDQDKFRFSGIFRDVYLLHRPVDRIEDYVIETDLSDDLQRADLKIRFSFSRKPVPVSLTLISPDGSGIIFQDTIRPGREGIRDGAYGPHTESVTVEVVRPRLWNAEDPVLYTLVIDTKKEVITEKVGFRKIEVKDLVVTLNGSPITFRGVNRHESDPMTGAVCSPDQALKDLHMIKAGNFNAVRASHYPNSPWFYQLCDELGLYVVDEADNESHGTGPLSFGEGDYTERMRKAYFRIADNPDFVEPTLDRIRSMVIRNRNRPSILVWSMGNECGYGRTFEEALRWTKENDPTRLTHYESAFYASPVRKFDLSNIDLYGRMYPGFKEVTDYLGNKPDIPLLLVEYCHSMGNGPGDFKEYRDLTEQYPALCGGFVWEWCDHAIYKGIAENGKAMYSYGGDHGELQHDGNFCLDGLVYPDRTPHTGLLEYKNVHRPLRASYDTGRQVLTIENHLDFTDPAGKISAAWTLTLDGTQIAEGPLEIPSIPPHTRAEIPLLFTVPDRGRCFLTVTYVLKKETIGLPAGHELGFDEIRIPTAEPRALKAAGLLTDSQPAAPGTLAVTETDRCLTIEGEGFTYQLDSLSGLFTSLRLHDRELLDRPADFNLWRAPTDNDVPLVDLWKLERLDHTVTRARRCHLKDNKEKTYLTWANKIGYGSGDIAGNVVYALLSAFVMIFLTDTVGMNAGIVGTLIAVSKLLDGVSDIFFGSMIDKTNTKMGKARPWMFYGYFGCAVCLVAIFCIPADISATAQYAWFFIAYTLLNAGFYTANNIAYSALTALITKNNNERVQMGSIRFMFAFGTSMLIQTITIGLVAHFGGGAAAWRTVAIIYAIAGVISNTLSVMSVRELSPEELAEGEKVRLAEGEEEKYSLADAFKLLIRNKYYLMICACYILMQIYSATLNMGIYYMTYVLKNANLLGVFSWFINIPMIIGLLFTPALVMTFGGMYKLNLTGYVIGTIGRLGVVIAGYLGSVPLMLICTAVAALGMSPLQGDMNALIATCSEYTYLTHGKRVDGTMYSCTSLGTKLGGGIGTALAGWLLAFSGYVGGAAVQSASTMTMLHIMYLWMPMCFNLLITLILTRLNVEKANEELRNKRVS